MSSEKTERPKFFDVGQPIEQQPMPSDIRRFMKKVRLNKKTGCWIWIGAKQKETKYVDDNGVERFRRRPYGKFRFAGKVHWAHRVAYWFFRGDLGVGFDVDHDKCDNPRCVCPWHLKLADPADNRKWDDWSVEPENDEAVDIPI